MEEDFLYHLGLGTKTHNLPEMFGDTKLIKLMHHAACKYPVFIRLGTCGGLGVPGGTVIISDGVLNDKLNPEHEFLDENLAKELKAVTSPCDVSQTVIAKTFCADYFHEGQGRLDGAFCDYQESDKMNWLNLLQQKGVVNIEMKSSMFAALTGFAGIQSAIICVAILNRLSGDQINEAHETLGEWQERPAKLLARVTSI